MEKFRTKIRVTSGSELRSMSIVAENLIEIQEQKLQRRTGWS
jgi:hypothetical protein